MQSIMVALSPVGLSLLVLLQFQDRMLGSKLAPKLVQAFLVLARLLACLPQCGPLLVPKWPVLVASSQVQSLLLVVPKLVQVPMGHAEKSKSDAAYEQQQQTVLPNTLQIIIICVPLNSNFNKHVRRLFSYLTILASIMYSSRKESNFKALNR